MNGARCYYVGANVVPAGYRARLAASRGGDRVALASLAVPPGYAGVLLVVPLDVARARGWLDCGNADDGAPREFGPGEPLGDLIPTECPDSLETPAPGEQIRPSGGGNCPFCDLPTAWRPPAGARVACSRCGGVWFA